MNYLKKIIKNNNDNKEKILIFKKEIPDDFSFEFDSHLPSLAVYPDLHWDLLSLHSVLSTQISVALQSASRATFAAQAVFFYNIQIDIYIHYH